MEDKEIIKALECCYNAKCSECPCYTRCVKDMSKNALDLINRQQAEIERLQDDNKYLQDRRWKELCEVKAEAIKEFAERLKETADSRMYRKDVVYTVEIYNLVKEMVGDTE